MSRSLVVLRGSEHRRRTLWIVVARRQERLVHHEGEGEAGDEQQEGEDQELGAGGLLAAPRSVIPGEHEGEEESDGQRQVDPSRGRLSDPPPGSQGVHHLEDEHGAGDVRQHPLDEPPLAELVEERMHGAWRIEGPAVDPRVPTRRNVESRRPTRLPATVSIDSAGRSRLLHEGRDGEHGPTLAALARASSRSSLARELAPCRGAFMALRHRPAAPRPARRSRALLLFLRLGSRLCGSSLGREAGGPSMWSAKYSEDGAPEWRRCPRAGSV